MRIMWIVLTDGRPYVHETLPAWRDVLGLTPTIVDDSGDGAQRASLSAWGRVIPVRLQRAGYVAAMQTVMNIAATSGAQWVFLTEDDFLPEESVPDLADMAGVLAYNDHLCQMVLKRQPWYPNEIEAGGVLEALDARMYQRSSRAGTWVEHQAFWSNNPCLFPVAIARRKWPVRQWSESWFGQELFEQGSYAAMWGAMGCPPQVRHIGVEKAGRGY